MARPRVLRTWPARLTIHSYLFGTTFSLGVLFSCIAREFSRSALRILNLLFAFHYTRNP